MDNQFLCVSSVQPNFYASLAARVGKGALSQHVYLDYRICNAATVARTTDVGLYLDWMPKPRCVLLGDIGLVDSASVTLPAYKRGVSDGCIRGTLDTGPLPAGVYKFGLKVDRKCAVTEATETDNVATATVTVGPKKTDLYGSVTYVRLGPKQYRYTFKVCRAGWAARPSFARVFEGPKPAGFVAPKIPCGSPTSAYGTIVAQGQVEVPPGCSTLDMTYTHAKTGWRMMCLALDTGCQVSEYNESNNIGCTFPLVR
ncbi:MAG: hypothetical protein D6685_14685 [Bacteroidetes bacterium]|nr:MAG: hypothetical protein D6685_14685 [Bacteroidota bacterium]